MKPWKEYTSDLLLYPLSWTSALPAALILLTIVLSNGIATAQTNVAAWGSNTSGQTSVPSDLTNAIAIAAGYSHSAALSTDGTVVCWGLNTSGQTNVPAGLSNVVAISCGQNHTLALKSDGTVAAWGGPASVLPPSDLSNVVAIAGTFNATYALFPDGTMQSWPSGGIPPSIIGNVMNIGSRIGGSGGGTSTTLNGALIGAAGANPGNFVTVLFTTGPALTIDGRVSLFSASHYTDAGLSNIVAISVGVNWPGLALRTDGTIYNGLASISNAVAIASGNAHSLALIGVGAPVFSTRPMALTITPGRLARLYTPATGQWPISYQWQFNGADILGATTPMLAVTNVASGNFGSYQVVATNIIGTNVSAPVTVSLLPIAGIDLTPNVTDIVAIASCNTNGHYLALKRDRTVLAWGQNDVGQCNVPAGLSNVVAISSYSPYSATTSHSLALTDSGTIYSWGKNNFTNTYPGLTNMALICAGGYYDLALTGPEGAFTSWTVASSIGPPTISTTSKNLAGVAPSKEQFSRLAIVGVDGIAHTADLTVPPGVSNFVSAARGDSLCVGLRADGTVLAWGLNNLGQTNVPPNLTNAIQVTALASTCALAVKDDGTLAAWGSLPGSVSNMVSTISNAVLVDGGAALIGTGAPFILDRSFDRAAVPGGQAFFRAMATGERPLHYQWRFNGTDLPGQTNNVLQLTNLNISQSGNYSVVVTNALGRASSVPSRLYVFDYAQALGSSNVSWTSFGDSYWFVQTNVTHDGVEALQSGPVFAPPTQQSTLRGTVTGPGTLTFWWKVSGFGQFETLSLFLNGNSSALSSISGEIDWQRQTIYLGAGLQTLDFVYRSTSSPAGYQHAGWLDDVTFTPGVTPVSFLTQPRGAAQAPGGDVGFSVSTVGTPPISYQWTLNGQNISGATNPSITLRNVQPTDGGLYSCIGSNMGGPSPSSNGPLVLGKVAEWGAFSALPPAVTNATALAAGFYHGLALQPDGSLLAWGNNNIYGQLSIPSDLTNITSIGAGAWFSMAVTAPNGTLTAWGDNSYGQSTVPPGLSNVLVAAGGSYHAAALRSDGTVVAWGRNEYGQTNAPPDLTNAVQIAGAGEHTIALRADGTVLCWGQNTYGESTVPPGLSDVVSVRAGFNHSLALKSDGSVIVWGNTNAGTHLFDIPALLTNAVSITAGGEYNLAISTLGQNFWWGFDRSGDAVIPSGLTNLVSITAGGYFSVGLVGDTIPSPAVGVRQPSVTNGHFQLTAATFVGRVYRLEYKNSLTDPNWQTLPLVAGTGAEQLFTDPSSIAAQRYYRLRTW